MMQIFYLFPALCGMFDVDFGKYIMPTHRNEKWASIAYARKHNRRAKIMRRRPNR